MTIRHFFLASAALVLILPGIVMAQDRLAAVASFSILGDMVAEVGGDRVEITTLVGPDGDAHVYQPTPQDARAVAEAGVLFVNGLAFEGWLDRLVEASEYNGPVIVATDGITPLEMVEGEHHGKEKQHAESEEKGDNHGGADPHAWQSLANARIYIANIETGLTAADPEGAQTYAANAADYLARIDAVEAEIIAALSVLSEGGRTVVTSHDAFGYFADAFGLIFLAPEGMSTESEASAKDVAALITQIRGDEVSAVFVENITDSRLVEQIAAETGARVGGTLYSDALSGVDGPAATYLEMMRHNATTLADALAQ
jgi:zinc/manganese transport system substrate-binding protein